MKSSAVKSSIDTRSWTLYHFVKGRFSKGTPGPKVGSVPAATAVDVNEAGEGAAALAKSAKSIEQGSGQRMCFE